MRGYFEIGVYHPKNGPNIGTLWRTAHTFGASGLFTIGRRYSKQASDTMKSWRSVPLRHYLSFDELFGNLPMGSRLVGVEMDESAIDLEVFTHPEQAIYLLGAEDHGLPERVQNMIGSIVSISSPRSYCLNVATAGAIVLYDRWMKRIQQ